MELIELYYVFNSENGKAFLVNADTPDNAVMIVANQYGYSIAVLGWEYISISQNDCVDIENIAM